MAKKTKKEIQAEERLNYTDKDLDSIEIVDEDELTDAEKARAASTN